MSIAQSLLPEFDEEVSHTRRTLERLPDDKLGWKPHPRSMTLGHLATLVADIPQWATMTCEQSELDLAPPGSPPPKYDPLPNTKAILAKLDQNAHGARAAIEKMSDTDFQKPWSLLMGDRTVFTLPKINVYRSSVMNHLVHHRGQLTLYLRLLDIPVPAIYGPSADEGRM